MRCDMRGFGKSDALDDPEILRAAEVREREIAGAQRVTVANAAHIPSMEQPGEYLALARE